MPENLSPFEHDIQATNERNFCETLDTIAKHSEDAVIETGEREGEPYTDILFVLREEAHTPATLRELQINLGLDSAVRAIITTEGSGVLVSTGISEGRLEEILQAKPELTPLLKERVEQAGQERSEQARQTNLDSVKDVTAAIKAGLGRTYAGE